ncbi:MAG: hypothetical protein WD960_04045 [Gemmatimonadota bacterium]
MKTDTHHTDGPDPAARLRPRVLLLATTLLGLAACDFQEAWSEPSSDTASTPVHVDSIFPIEEEIRRFRDGTEQVESLSGGEASKEALVERLIHALEVEDVETITSLAMTRNEFAWLYYPHTMYTARPYELSPALVWYHQQNRSSRGLTRLLDRYAGETLYYAGFNCPDEGEAFGEGHIWHGCSVLGSLPTGEEVEERIFGSILEWGGRYKLVSFSNEF